MSDNNDDTTNPLIVAKADKPSADVRLDDCCWDSDEMDALQDAYFLLRDAGFSATELQSLGELLNNTTLFTASRTEVIYNEFVADTE